MSKLYRLLRYDWPLHFVLVLTNWLPDNVPFLRLRGWLARLFLRECGSGFSIGRNVTLYNPSRIRIGNNVYIAYGCWFMAGETITIEDEVMFGPYCVVVSGEHVRSSGSYRNDFAILEPIHIGKGAWMSSHITITSGAQVGSGVLVAANSVVLGSLPPNVLAAGQPAVVKKTL